MPALFDYGVLWRCRPVGSGIMKNTSYVVVVVALALSLSAVAQQQGKIPPGGTPPTFPPDSSAPKPRQKADPEKSPLPLTSQELKIQIVKKLQTQPGLSSRNIHVKVIRDTVLLRGSVPTAHERTVAERIAKSSSGDRRVENRLAVHR
jgi:BON domain